MEQTMPNEHNKVKNPNWPEAILQAWLKIWTQDYHEQIQLAVRVGLELVASGFQVQIKSSALTAQPRCLHNVV